MRPQDPHASLVPQALRGGTGNLANLFSHQGQISADFRCTFFGHRPVTLWLTGLSGAGKSTIAYELERTLLEHGHACCVLDGDNIRQHLNKDLGFSEADRTENIRRTAEVARLMNDAGILVIAALISPFRKDREMAKTIIGADRCVEVYVSTAREVCESRDPKGLYAKARAGKITAFTGISSPYEPPLGADLVVDTDRLSLDQSATYLFSFLAHNAFMVGGAISRGPI